jgi:PEP-CTERM motif
MNRASVILAIMAVLFFAVDDAIAGPIASRGALVTLLGGPGTVEDFSSYSVQNGVGEADATGISFLDSTTIVNGEGPGLIVPGVNFTFGTGQLQWDAAGYFGAPSQEILSGAPSGQPLVITFTSSVNAFGATATMQIYAPDDTTLIGTVSNIGLPDSGVPVFEGWQDAGGIGRVSLTQSGQQWSPLIENLEFGDTGGAATPEPASLALLGIGVAGIAGHAWRRRKLALA